ncbi:1-acyl-sn-glycerol-3-phosphate acyltransferase [Saprospira grandis]|uniref:1-acyl-sn-glycerol-3-phosphate acyltransferase n=1 Tax=Saprospira grandis TaxID=1008 RepID=UPI0022DDBAD2|nr:1-acyl-sn-glycerol-3-phosphate acyltransferase [Saprospira grandis]WBM74870.1 1-acyl-sn-glycerol-3-phosphate acyltransferase [Saprospira grandis]
MKIEQEDQSYQAEKAYPLPSVIEDLNKWPINQLYRDKKAFMDQLVAFTQDRLIAQKKGGELAQKIAAVVYKERQRILENPWKVDPPDELDFWGDIRRKLVKGAKLEGAEAQAHHEQLSERILRRYTEEITGDFKISTYKLARILLPMLFNSILNTLTIRKADLRKKLRISGHVEELRSLVDKGTVVFVPTHFSNLDSILIGWAADRIGMLAFSYGAGLNLFNNKIMSYFFSRLGAYTLDRRKKNPFYLESLKSFSQLSIERGVHSLFFPGGTRSRDGALEERLKLGLLGTAIDAQGAVLERGEKNKVYIVPVVLNYHFVLEAKSLIEQHLKYTGKELYIPEGSGFSAMGILKYLRQFVYNSSEILVNFGQPMDVMGNFVDEEGRSLDPQGREVDLKDYYTSAGQLCYDRQRNEVYTERLADKIVERFRVENVVLSSHLLAFTAFNIIKARQKEQDLYGILRLPKEERRISQALLFDNLKLLRTALKELEAKGELKLSEMLAKNSLEELVADGLQNIGAFHVNKPLFWNKKEGCYESEDLNLLYYYHNRMKAYGLHRLIKI